MVANSRRPSIEELTKGVNEYIANLKAMPEDKAREISLNTLKRTGVVDENGNTKEQIVTGDFFGW